MKTSEILRFTVCLGLIAAGALACSDAPVAPEPEPPTLLARGGGGGGGGGGKPAPPPPAVFTLHDLDVGEAPTGFRSDGRGPYADGACGVYATIFLDDTRGMSANLLPKRDSANAVATCGYAREANVHLLVRHLSDDPHVDDTSTPIGEREVFQVGVRLDGGTLLLNTRQACFKILRSGKASGYGLRFNPGAFPGSSPVDVAQLAAGHYRVQTRPYPDNLAFCEDNSGVSFWHVVVDFEVQAAG